MILYNKLLDIFSSKLQHFQYLQHFNNLILIHDQETNQERVLK